MSVHYQSGTSPICDFLSLMVLGRSYTNTKSVEYRLHIRIGKRQPPPCLGLIHSPNLILFLLPLIAYGGNPHFSQTEERT
jgi:hypothetical protein